MFQGKEWIMGSEFTLVDAFGLSFTALTVKNRMDRFQRGKILVAFFIRLQGKL
jgi:hypothetical protein